MGNLKNTFLTHESICTLIISVGVALLLCMLHKQLHYDVFMGVAAALLGSLIILASILISIPKKGRIKVLCLNESYYKIFYTFIISIISQAGLLIFSIIGLLGAGGYIFNFLFFFILTSVIGYLLLDIYVFIQLLDIIFLRK